MQSSTLAFCLIAISVGLGTCFVWVLHEIEDWRRRRHERAELVRDAMRFVVRPSKAAS